MFIVFVEENSHYMDELGRVKFGEYPNYTAAMEAAKEIVGRNLIDLHQPGMGAKKLFELYETFGQDAFIMPDEGHQPFSARDYARERCNQTPFSDG